jgi:hypothetical protein
MAVFHDDGRFFAATPRAERAFVVYRTLSSDDGLTWSAPQAIARHEKAHLCEPGLVRAPRGSQMAMLLRENSRKFRSFITFSADEGGTWSTPREMPPELTGDRHVARYLKDGRLFITFRDMAPESPTRGDWVAWIGRYADLVDGTPGQCRLRLMKNHQGTDCAYAGLEVLRDGTVVTTTYGHWTPGAAPYIVCVRIEPGRLPR